MSCMINFDMILLVVNPVNNAVSPRLEGSISGKLADKFFALKRIFFLVVNRTANEPFDIGVEFSNETSGLRGKADAIAFQPPKTSS